ncbi:hypothetical protein VP01_8556g1, partial [Puccinia sorghi]
MKLLCIKSWLNHFLRKIGVTTEAPWEFLHFNCRQYKSPILNINKKYATNIQLLIPAYKHYLHFLQTNQFNREKHQLEIFCQDEEHCGTPFL